MHGVHRSWIYKLLARYRAGGYERVGGKCSRWLDYSLPARAT